MIRTTARQALAPALRLSALGAVAACCWTLAPAISATPYIPPAQDFEQRLRGVAKLPAAASARAHAGEGPVSHRSGVLRAPARFDAAGLAGELRHYELRARESGAAWGPWTEVANGDPVWFGGAEELQLRTRGWRPAGRIHYVNVSGDATAGDAALTAARGTVSDLAVGAVRLIAGESATAAPARPRIMSRTRWGADERPGGCRPRRTPDRGRVRAAVVHHTVTSNRYTRAEAPGIVLAICRYHRNGNGWDDIGYNALVDRFGRLYEGRDGGLRRAVVGAHAQGFNSYTTGLASIGTNTKVELSRKALGSAADFLAWKLAIHNKTAAGRTTLISSGGSASRYDKGERVRTKKIVGHRRLGLTECPGRALNGQLKRLRRMTQRRQEAAGTDGDGGKTGGVDPRMARQP